MYYIVVIEYTAYMKLIWLPSNEQVLLIIERKKIYSYTFYSNLRVYKDGHLLEQAKHKNWMKNCKLPCNRKMDTLRCNYVSFTTSARKDADESVS